MTLAPERPPRTAGDEALERLNMYLDPEERFELLELDQEFAFYTQRLGTAGLYLADATRNMVGTFKLRGALNKIAKEQKNGAASAWLDSRGNHLLGGAAAGRILSMPVAAYVPANTSPVKLRRARQIQPDASMLSLRVEGAGLEESRAIGEREATGVYVPPFDDSDVSAGQGTIADDTVRAAQRANVKIDHYVMALGGGGGVTGVARRLTEIDPEAMVHAIETEGNSSMSLSLAADRLTQAESPNIRFGGAAVRRVGALAFNYFQTASNIRLWPVTTDEVGIIAEEYLDERFHRQLRHDPLEPTSLAAVAALGRIVKEYPGDTIAVIGTGRNAPIEDLWK